MAYFFNLVRNHNLFVNGLEEHLVDVKSNIGLAVCLNLLGGDVVNEVNKGGQRSDKLFNSLCKSVTVDEEDELRKQVNDSLNRSFNYLLNKFVNVRNNSLCELGVIIDLLALGVD